MKIVKQGKKNSHTVKCKYCDSVIRYWDNEVDIKDFNFPLIDKYLKGKYITCPVCKNDIEIEEDDYSKNN